MTMFRDLIQVSERLKMVVRHGANVVKSVVYDTREDVVQANGFVSMVCRERGKIVPGTRRWGHNIWTLAGREHLAQLMSYRSYGPPLVGERRDRIRYFGFGSGSQPEVSSVDRLVTPIAFDSGANFLAQLSLPTYPLSPSKTTVRYTRVYTETELSTSGNVTLTEAGLYTDGAPGSDFEPGTRDITLANALLQAPNAYKVFDPLTKTQNFVLEVSWEVRF
jgi:hypothetical protein